jgi:hypothetical protein
MKNTNTTSSSNPHQMSVSTGERTAHRDHSGGGGYRTVDLSHLDRNGGGSNSGQKRQHDNFFLLKDLSKLVNEPPAGVNMAANQNTGGSITNEIFRQQQPQRPSVSFQQMENRFKVEKINDLV